MYLLETSFLIDLSRERRLGKGHATRALAGLNLKLPLCVSTITLGELSVGWHLARSARSRKHNRRFNEWLKALCKVVPYDERHAESFGHLAVGLRRQGQSVPAADLQIAAVAITEKWHLVTRDTRHFERFPELDLVTYTLD